MTISHEFDYFRPASLDEAVGLLDRFGAAASVLAGGTDLVGWLREDLVTPEALIDLKAVPGLDAIEVRGQQLKIGSLVTFNQVIGSEPIAKHAPLFAEMAKVVASTGVRNRATLVGNICSSVPCCDTGPVLLVYDAVIVVRGKAGERRIPISEWFVAPRKTSLAAGELVTHVEITLPTGRHAGCYVKLRRYKGEDLAQASVAILALANDAFHVAFGAVAPTPVRGERIGKALQGKQLSDAAIAAAKDLLPEETAPITDVRASKEYRAHMLRVMLERGLKAAAARLAGGGPAYGEELL